MFCITCSLWRAVLTFFLCVPLFTCAGACERAAGAGTPFTCWDSLSCTNLSTWQPLGIYQHGRASTVEMGLSPAYVGSWCARRELSARPAWECSVPLWLSNTVWSLEFIVTRGVTIADTPVLNQCEKVPRCFIKKGSINQVQMVLRAIWGSFACFISRSSYFPCKLLFLLGLSLVLCFYNFIGSHRSCLSKEAKDYFLLNPPPCTHTHTHHTHTQTTK